MSDVAERIKKLRTHFGFTQEQLGKKAEVSKAAVSGWERGLARPEREALLSLQLNLDINPRWISKDDGEMLFSKSNNEVKEDPPTYMPQKTTEFISVFLQLANEEQDQIIALTKLLASKHKDA